MDKSKNEIKNMVHEPCLIKNPLFGLLKAEELELLNKTRVEVSFKKGEIIYKQGMPLTHLVILNSGYGKIYIEGNGRNLTLKYTKAHDINGGIGLFLDQIHHSSLMAVNDSTTCFINVKAFNEVMEGNAVFRDAYLKEYSERILQTYNQFVILTQKNMEGRMAESILFLKNHVFNNGGLSYLSKQDFADYTAMSKESANRVLKRFQEEALIEMKGEHLIVLNEPSLQRIADFG
jgi:CRP/FNR family transcriptional regulator